MLRRIKRNASKLSKTVAVGAVAVASATQLHAVDVYGQTVTMDTTNVTALMGEIVVGLAVLWGIRKVIKTVNRS